MNELCLFGSISRFLPLPLPPKSKSTAVDLTMLVPLMKTLHPGPFFFQRCCNLHQSVSLFPPTRPLSPHYLTFLFQRADIPQPLVTMDTANNYVLIHGKNISHNAIVGSAAGAHMSIDKLFPALLECFGIILCGYIAGR